LIPNVHSSITPISSPVCYFDLLSALPTSNKDALERLTRGVFIGEISHPNDQKKTKASVNHTKDFGAGGGDDG
jgi:hypothetical protein